MDSLAKAIRDDTLLVSVGMVNNEIGVTQSMKEIVGVLHKVKDERNKVGNHMPLYFHTDATQAAGSVDLSVARAGVDLLTLGGNKIYGPKQSGILYKAASLKLDPLIHGSGQEQDLRSGTENAAGIVGMAEALAVATELRPSETKRLEKIRNLFIKQLASLVPDTVLITDQKHDSPHIIMAAWAGLDGERLVFRLELEGVLVNTGAACAAKKEGHSHVLRALGISPTLMAGSLRFSFGRETGEDDVLRAVKIIAQAIKRERENVR
jgi:cysteine desulfurase